MSYCRRTVSCFLLFLIVLLALPFPGFAAERTGMHSSELQRVVSEEGSVQRIDYIYNGVITYAADKHYATCVQTKDGRKILYEYFDENGAAVRQPRGYCSLVREYNEEGKIENEFYFDENRQPVALSLNQYGQHREYDSEGRISVLTYLGIDGTPVKTNRGYASVKRSFYPDGTVETEMYYDIYGQPAALSHGQYGIRHVDGKNIYLDINGREIFSLNNYLHNNLPVVALIALNLVIVSSVLGKKENTVLLIMYLGFIAYMTLMYREEGDARMNLEIFWSYKRILTSPGLRLEILNNILLFIPLGAILYRLSEPVPSPVSAAVFFSALVPVFLSALISVLIETLQYFTGLGLAELDDVISNSLGACAGASAGWMIRRLFRRI